MLLFSSLGSGQGSPGSQPVVAVLQTVPDAPQAHLLRCRRADIELGRGRPRSQRGRLLCMQAVACSASVWCCSRRSARMDSSTIAFNMPTGRCRRLSLTSLLPSSCDIAAALIFLWHAARRTSRAAGYLTHDTRCTMHRLCRRVFAALSTVQHAMAICTHCHGMRAAGGGR